MKFLDDIAELVYLEFQDIDPKAYQSRIRYFEQNKNTIANLPYELRLEMSLEYVVALFEVGDYYQYLKHVDKLLRKVIDENIFSIYGDDIYQELLYRKAASLHNLVDYFGAEHVLGALCKIDKNSLLYRQTFIKNSTDSLRYQGQRVRGIIIAMMLMTGLIIGVELLVIRPFFEAQVTWVELSRNLLMTGAITLLLFQEMRIRFLSYRKYKYILQD